MTRRYSPADFSRDEFDVTAISFDVNHVSTVSIWIDLLSFHRATLPATSNPPDYLQQRSKQTFRICQRAHHTTKSTNLTLPVCKLVLISVHFVFVYLTFKLPCWLKRHSSASFYNLKIKMRSRMWLMSRPETIQPTLRHKRKPNHSGNATSADASISSHLGSTPLLEMKFATKITRVEISFRSAQTPLVSMSASYTNHFETK